MKTKAKRLISLALVICVLLSTMPMFELSASAIKVNPIAIEPKQYTASDNSIWLEGYADEATDNFRASQTIEVKTSGYASNAKLTYSYYATQCSTAFSVINGTCLFLKTNKIDISVRLDVPLIKLKEKKAVKGNIFKKAAIKTYNVAVDVFNVYALAFNYFIMVDNLLHVDDAKNNQSPLFRVYGKDACDCGVRIVVNDTNPESPTYNVKKEITLNKVNSADLAKDIGVPYSMYVGESKTIYELLEETGVGHINGCENSNVTYLNISNYKNNAISKSNNNITAVTPGIAKMDLTVKKTASCLFHPGQTASGSSYIYVFKKPKITTDIGTIKIEDTQKDVIYNVGDTYITCTEDNQIIEFTELEGETQYRVTLIGELPNGQRAKKHFVATTPKPYYGYLKYSFIEGATHSHNLIVRTKNTKSKRPETPTAYGHVLANWYDDPACTQLHDFDKLINSDFTIYGKWEALKSSLTLTLNNGEEPITDVDVELYQNGVLKHKLTELGNGKFYIADAVYNGTYRIYINGQDTMADIQVKTKRTENDITKYQYDNRLSGDNIKISVTLNQLTVVTRLDDAVVQKDGFEFVYGSKVTKTYHKNNNSICYFVSTDNNVYDIYLNGADTDTTGGFDSTKNISRFDKTKYIDLYTIKVNAETDEEDWVSDNFELRNGDGDFVASLTPGKYKNGVRLYSVIIQKDDKNPPTDLYVYADGVNTGYKVTATSSGREVTIPFRKYAITVNQDDQPKTDAQVTVSNGKHKYELTENDNGVYVVRVFNNSDFTVSVYGTTDSKKHILNSSSKNLTLDYYSVDYITSTASELNTTKYRSYTVLKGEIISPPTGAYLAGKTFSCWNESEYAEDEGLQTPFDFSSAITKTTTLYAHFNEPKVDINTLVRCDSAGKQSSTGTYYTMPSLTVSGYDDGNIIASAQITGTNLTTVKLPENSNVTVTLSNNSTVSASGGFFTVPANFTKELSVTFTNKVSQQNAEKYLRGIVFGLNENTNGSISVKVSEDLLSSYEIPTLTQTQAAADSWTIITDIPYYDFGIYQKATKFYFTKSLTFHRPNNPGYGGIGIRGDVTFYIPKGVTITCQGAQGSINGTVNGNAGGSGIYLLSGNSLTVYGEGTLQAYGGNGADATAGANGGAAVGYVVTAGYTGNVLDSGAGGAGGRGAGGGGAGIGSDGAGGGAGGAGGASVSITATGTSAKGNNGGNGTAGGTPNACGQLYVADTITLDVKGGKGGKAYTVSSSDGGKIKTISEMPNALSGDWQTFYASYASPGAGGGGGGAASDGYAIGAGGSGGGGGAGGAGGSIVGGWYLTATQAAFAYGGGGGFNVGSYNTGAAGGSFTTSYQLNDASYNTYGGTGGNSGAVGSFGTKHVISNDSLALTQTQAAQDSWTIINDIPYYDFGYHGTTTKFYFTKSLTFHRPNQPGYGGMGVYGNVIFYIPKGVTITCQGAQGSNSGRYGNGGGSGVYCLPGNTLTIYGEGTLNAFGGDGADASPGENGGDATTTMSGAGGAGGRGAGGGGAGIGSDGGGGWYGGAGGAGVAVPSGAYSVKGNAGSNGTSTSAPIGCGTLYISSTITLNVKAGKGGKACTISGVAGKALNYNNFNISPGAGGGGGGAAGDGQLFGAGGTGGGAGAGGAGGSIIAVNDTNADIAKAASYGGVGGGCVGTTERGASGGSYEPIRQDTSYDTQPGVAGDAGPIGVSDTKHTLNDILYFVNFGDAKYGGTVASYVYTSGASSATKRKVIVPDYTPAVEGVVFKGWKIAVYAKQLPDADGNYRTGVGNTASSHIYQPGDTIVVSQYAYGDITYEPILEKVVPKFSSDTALAEAISADVATTYYSYIVNATVDGVKTDVGKLKLVNAENETDVITLGSDGEGTYSYISTESKVYKIYTDGNYSGKTVSADGTANLDFKSVTVNVQLDGENTGLIGNVILKGTNNSLVPDAVMSGDTNTGVYKIIDEAQKFDGAYRIIVNGIDTGIDISAGEIKTVSFTTTSIPFAGNYTPKSVVLHSEDGKETELEINADTLNAVTLSDTQQYEVIVDGISTGKMYSLGVSDKILYINKLTVNVKKDGVLQTVSGYEPQYNGNTLQNASAGKYQAVIFDQLGNVTVRDRSFTPVDGVVNVNLYTVSYDIGSATGDCPIDGNIYFEGDSVSISSEKSLFVAEKEFSGWTTGETTYPSGGILKNISGTVTFTAVFKNAEDFDAIITIGPETHYVMKEDIPIYLKDKENPADIIIKKSIPLTSITLEEDDTLTIEEPCTVTVPKDEVIINKGTIIIEDGGTLIDRGEIENDGDIIIEGITKIEDDGVLINKKDGTITNKGTLEHDGEKLENEGEIENDGIIIINNPGSKNDGIIHNEGKIITESDPEDTLENYGVIISDGGEYGLPIDNDDGIIKGGIIIDKGIITGGQQELIQNNEEGEKIDEKKKQEEEEALTAQRETVKGTNALYYLLDVDDSEEDEYIPLDADGKPVVPTSEDEEIELGISYTQGTAKKLPTNLKKEGYIFEGWCKNLDFSDLPTFSITEEDTGDIVFIAKWSKVNRYCETPDETIPVMKDPENGTTLDYRFTGNCVEKVGGLGDAAIAIKKQNPNSNVSLVLNANSVDRDASSVGQNAITAVCKKHAISYLDIGVTLKTDENETVLTNLPKVVEIIIPVDLTGKLDIGITRYYNGEVQSFTNSQTEADKTFYIEGSGETAKLHIFADSFGDYAIEYNNVIPDAVKNATYYASLTLHQNINVNFSMENLGRGFLIDNLTVTVDGEEAKMVLDDDGNAVGILKAVAPYQMGKPLHIVVSYNGDIIKEFDYSILKYCNAVFNAQGYGKESELGKLCTAILNYGKYAQDYYNEYYGITADASTINAGNEINFDVDNYFGNFKSVDNGFKPSQIVTSAGASLSLASNITLNFHIYTPLNITADNILILNNLGEKVNSKNISIEAISDSIGSGYLVKINNIGSAKLSRTYTLTIKGISATTFKIVYGVESYCYDAQGVDSEAYPQYTDTLKTLCKAIFGYAEAAKAYAESLSK